MDWVVLLLGVFMASFASMEIVWRSHDYENLVALACVVAGGVLLILLGLLAHYGVPHL